MRDPAPVTSTERHPKPYNPDAADDGEGAEMTVQRSDPEDLAASELDPAAHADLVRRATQLCLRSEPHAEQTPCASHLSEANRQLFWLAV